MVLISVSTWNVLADSYSHGLTNIPSEVIYWENRSSQLRQCLLVGNSDVYCLQEADHYDDFYKVVLNEAGYESVYLQRPNRQDGCVIAFKRDRFVFVDKEEIFMDHLVELINSIQLRESFLRQNVGLIVQLRDLQSGKGFVVSTTHIYWNPMKPEVKAAQCKYLLNRVESYLLRHPKLPVFITGDFNSLPLSEPYMIVTNYTRRYNILEPNKIERNEVTGMLYGPETKFICDHSLVRLCRWMRAMGIDVALFDSDYSASTKHIWDSTKSTTTPMTPAPTSHSPQESTVPHTPAPPVASEISKKRKGSKDFSPLFDRARREKRVILTTSRLMKERANCPQYYFITSEKMGHLEAVLADIIREFGLELSPDKFLTVCGKCGGEITACEHTDIRISQMHVPDDKQIYICLGCHQAYWWDERESSSPARAMKMAGKLYSAVLNELQKPSPTVTPNISEASPEEKTDVDGIEPTTTRNNTHTQLSASADIVSTRSSQHSPRVDHKNLHANYSAYSFKVPFEEGTPDHSIDLAALHEMMRQRDSYLLGRDSTPLPSTEGSVSVHDSAGVSPKPAAHIEEGWLSGCVGDNCAISEVGWLRSAFRQRHGEEPLATNWGGDFRGTLDYIFISSEVLAKQVYVVPQVISSIEQSIASHATNTTDSLVSQLSNLSLTSSATYVLPNLWTNLPINSCQPSSLWPSDHFLLMGYFEI